MLFLAFTVFIFGLQYFHRRLLLQILSAPLAAWIVPVLVAIHLPLGAFVGMRLIGLSGTNLWMRNVARVGLYFQVLTLLNLLLWVLATGVWRMAHLWRNGAGAPPENPDRRRFLRQTSSAGVGIAAYGVMVGTLQARSDPDIVRQEFPFPDLPAGLDGLRIVQITDIHAGPLMQSGQLARWRRLAEQDQGEEETHSGISPS